MGRLLIFAKTGSPGRSITSSGEGFNFNAYAARRSYPRLRSLTIGWCFYSTLWSTRCLTIRVRTFPPHLSLSGGRQEISNFFRPPWRTDLDYFQAIVDLNGVEMMHLVCIATAALSMKGGRSGGDGRQPGRIHPQRLLRGLDGGSHSFPPYPRPGIPPLSYKLMVPWHCENPSAL